MMPLDDEEEVVRTEEPEDDAEFNEDLAQFADVAAEDDVEPSQVSEADESAGEEGEPAEAEPEEAPKVEPESDKVAEAPTETPAEPEAATEEPAPAPSPEQQPVATPEPPAAVPQPQQLPPQPSLEEQQAAFVAQRENAEKMLAEHYKLPTELAEGLDPDLAEALPRMGAKIFMDAVSHTLHQVTQILPQAVQGITAQQTTQHTLEDQFFEKWPGLREHADTVVRFGQSYRQLNPHASAEQFMEEVGTAVSVLQRIPLPNGEQPAAAPTEPTAPKFQPAAKAAPRGGSGKSDNMFTQLDSELFADEEV
jgi:hypothetical protein